MSNENNPKVKIISEYFIKPKYEVKQSNHPYYLSANDLSQLSTPYMHRGLLYSKPPSLLSINSLVDNLKESMSIALVDFYPLGGRLSTIKYEDEHASWVYVDPDIGPGARLIHASVMEENEVTVSDIFTCYESISRFIWSLFDMGDDPKIVNHDGHTRPLVSVQVTDLVDGVLIGFTMNHAIGDGTSLWHFINTLSKIFMGRGDDVEKPIFKTMIADGYGPVLKLPYLDSSEFIHRFEVDPRLRLRVFHFSADSIARLKARARVNNNNNNSNNNNIISSFQALAAFMWISVARARNLSDESDIGCWVSSNTRPKHDPPVPSNQFGNFVHLIKVTSKMDELMKNGLCWAAMLLHQGVMGLDENLIRANLKARTESPHVAIPMKRNSFGTNPPLVFAGSMRFDAYGPEFGLGKPVTTRTGCSTWMNGKIIIDPGREGGGSVDLQVCLLSETMTALEYDDEFVSYIS
ncbi:putative acetyltransferase At3g50280 [Silene latifolia]|uniref:putative acetyltransferase At3g50280 n=1 Tax=Silene latifolia TaxID=37657 RepID=UPI003D77CAC6